MNQNVNHKKVLAELKDNIAMNGMPEFEDFRQLCEYVRDFVLTRYDLEFDDQINCGYCFVWAYLVWAIWAGDGITFVSTTGHVVIKYNDMYWDAENCEGRDNLKGFCSFGETYIRKHIDVRWMCWYWARAGTARKELRRIIRMFDPKTYKLVKDNNKKYWKNPHDFYGYKELPHLAEVA